jgi:single-strand DNA-binding protein
MSINLVIFSGRVGTDPEYKEISETSSVCRFPVASDRKWGKEENQRETTWMDIECWAGLAKLTKEYVHKGKEVTVVGRLRKEVWEDKDGNKKSTIRVVAEDINFHGKKETEQKSDQDVESVLNAAFGLVDQGFEKDVAIRAVLGK